MTQYIPGKINASDIIYDFEQGSDQVDISNLDLVWSDLEVSQSESYTLIHHEASQFEIKLEGDYHMMESDFIFV